MPWTEEEDAILASHADRPPSWEGWASLLPAHSASAVKNRLHALRRAARASEPRMPSPPEPLRVTPPAEAGRWDEEELELLTEAMGLMAETGHTLSECMSMAMAVCLAWREGNVT